MDFTDFAGLTVLDPGETLSTNGYSFQSVNPRIIDYLLRLGATLHHHDGAAPLDAPTDELVPVLAAGGSIGADRDLFLTYTLLDATGGETLAAPAAQITTPGPIPAPTSGPTVAIDYTAGSLVIGTYYYVLTYTDGSGGETTKSPYAAVVREAGHANGRVMFTNLNVGMPTGAAGWRLYKSTANQQYRFIGEGTSADATFIDDGLVCADCTGQPPTFNKTGGGNALTVPVPTLPAEASGFRLYGSDSGAFTNPAFLGQWPDTQTDPLSLLTFNPGTGAPPVLPTAVGGAAKIEATTDINNIAVVAGSPRWKPPVANAAALPATGNTAADVRVTLDDFVPHIWDGDSWEAFGGGGGSAFWGDPAADFASLPATGSNGEVRVTLDSMLAFVWWDDGWYPFPEPPPYTSLSPSTGWLLDSHVGSDATNPGNDNSAHIIRGLDRGKQIVGAFVRAAGPPTAYEEILAIPDGPAFTGAAAPWWYPPSQDLFATVAMYNRNGSSPYEAQNMSVGVVLVRSHDRGKNVVYISGGPGSGAFYVDLSSVNYE